jgi:hypothetical protein
MAGLSEWILDLSAIHFCEANGSSVNLFRI